MSRIRMCGTSNKRGGTAGIILMILGLLTLMLFVPYWLWTSVLGIVLVVIGFIIWRS